MSYDNNFYYSPENAGLKIVGQLNDPQADYSFDDLIVWQHEDGIIYYASDSGCSCPCPFEQYEVLEDLNKLDDWNEFQTAVEGHCDFGSWRDGWVDPLAADKTQLLEKVARILREQGK